ncbi:hypothetical protein [Bradyrhizobium sp. F1.13.3]|uniref:hypothetical protein n=1 Tax=Bradyrhizobium sp. F1.13.3 TaxID=3156351 RepID=UPI0033967837
MKRHQGWDFVFRLIKNGAKFAYCHEPLATCWNEEDPNRVSKQKSIGPPLLWLKVGSAGIAKDAATAFYFRDVFGKHLKQRPFAALAMALRLALSDVGSTAWVLQRIPLLRRIPIRRLSIGAAVVFVQPSLTPEQTLHLSYGNRATIVCFDNRLVHVETWIARSECADRSCRNDAA